MRNKFRTTLTVLGVAVAILTFVLLRTVLTSWTRSAEVTRKDIIVTRHKVSFVFPLPIRYVETMRQLPGVKQVTPGVWFAGTDPRHEREFFATMAYEASSYFDVYTDTIVTAETKAAWLENRRAAIVGDALATKLGWKVGDRVTLESGKFPAPPDKPWTFDIVGIYTPANKSVDRSTFFMRYDYVNDSLPPEERDKIGWAVVRLNDGIDSAEMTRKIDQRFADDESQTLSQDERTFRTQFLAGIAAVLQGLNIVSIIIVVIIMLILGNTIAMGVRERTTEYGTLRALGFLPSHVRMFIAVEAIAVGLIGGVIGLALAVPLIQVALSESIEREMGGVFPFFRMDTSTAVIALLLSGLLGLLASAIPALRVARLSIVDALRRVA